MFFLHIYLYIYCIIRSWLNEMFMHSRTVSLRLKDSSAAKCSSDNYSQKHIGHPWKTVRSAFHCIIVLQWRGEGPK